MESPGWSITLFITTVNIKQLIWFIIVTVNIGLTIAAIFMWVQCNPPRKVWETNIPGTCWDRNVVVSYNSIISGKSLL